jgi:hypothetical protein
LSISRNDNCLFNRIDWHLGTLNELGYLGACAHIGKVVLKMLHTAHVEVFAPYPNLAPEESSVDPDDGVHYLLRASVVDRTRAYLPAIDALVERHADALTQSLREEWPELRARILRDYPD